MTDNNEWHVVFGTWPVGMAVADELLRRGRRVQMVNCSGWASVTAGAMWKRNWWRSSRRGRAPDYGGTVKMAFGAFVSVVLVLVLLQLLGLT